jgi:hypothetical protein
MNDSCSAGVCSGVPLDGDGDNYVSDACGGNDCDDGNAAVNPGATEGPSGDPTCSDTADNDCDGNTDAADPDCTSSDEIVADHNAVAGFNNIPEAFIRQAQADFRISYGHTSHGSQIVSGMYYLQAQDDLYSFNHDGTGGVLSLHDREPDGDLGNPDRTTWAQRTRDLLNQPGNDRNFIIWAWCGQVTTAGEADINTYLNLMNQLEQDFPDVTFVYMTGHLDGTGVAGNLNVRNNQIRDYCRTNGKILFDFADIESYDPDGNYFLDRGADDECNYNGGNWADEWCGANPGSPMCSDGYCAHSKPLNCHMKVRVFWWLLARLAGWDGN